MSNNASAKPRRASAGGPAAMGGLSFQAAVTAIALVACATSKALDWWDGPAAIPVRVLAETGGDGDDIGLELMEGATVEVQAKKGLQRGADLWTSLLRLATGVHEGRIDFGLLAISPGSSRTVASDLANDIKRLAQGRSDNLTEIGSELVKRLQSASLPVEAVCQKLAIQTIGALAPEATDIRNAVIRLEGVLATPAEARRSWDVLAGDAAQLIALRGARTADGVSRLLQDHGIAIASNGGDGTPLVTAAGLRVWTIATNATFTIIGVKTALPLDSAWIPVKCQVQSPETDSDLAEAMKRYHAWKDRSSRDASPVEPMTLGRFYRRAVVVAGPGMGKSTLLKRLAGVYAKEGRPVARASLRSVATRMKVGGETFPEAFFAIALGGSPVPDARNILACPWCLLADGLDECGAMQDQVAQGLVEYAASNPNDTIVVVTRPIGYKPAPFDAWRHYELLPFDSTAATPHLADLVEAILKPQGKAPEDPFAWVTERTKGADLDALAARSPLLLSLSASLLALGIRLTGHVGDLYAQVLKLIEDETRARPVTDLPAPWRSRVLDALGDLLVRAPLTEAHDAEVEAGRRLAAELGITPLAAAERVTVAIAHWEAVGVIERLHHEGDQVLTFVHKTIGEYVAARYIVSLEGDQRRDAIGSLITVAEGAEPLRFAAVLGAGDAVCDALLTKSSGDAGYTEVIRSLGIAADPLAKVSVELQARIVERAIDLFLSESRRVGIDAGVALLAHLPAHAHMVARAIRPHLDDARPWVRLGAWAMLLKIDAPDLDFDALKATFAEVPKFYRESMNLSLGRGLRLFSRSEGDFIQPFAIAAARRILQCEDPAVAKTLIEAALDVEHLGGFIFVHELKALSQAFDVPLTFQHNKTRDWGDFWNNEEYTDALRAAYRKVLGPLARPSDGHSEVSIDEPYHFADLAAFLTLCGFNYHLAKDLDAADVAGSDGAIAEIGRAVIMLAGFSPERLAHQSAAFLDHVNTPDQPWYELRQLPHVDVEPIDWDGAAAAGVDPLKIEPLLYHASSETAFLAARAIDGAATVPVRLDIAARALERGSGWTTGMAAALALATNTPEGLDQIYARLGRPSDIGRRSIYKVLKQQPPTYDDRTAPAIKRGLSSNEDVAVEAAEWALTYAEAGRSDLLDVLEAGYAHWVTAERPSEPGKAIPNSPRGTLLEAIFLISPPPLERLFALMQDRRSEVHTAAHKEIARRFAAVPDADEPIFNAVADRRLGRSALNLYLKSPERLTPDRLKRLLAWFESDDASLREDIVPLLAAPFMAPAEITRWSQRLIQDPDFHVREAGHRLLRGSGAEPVVPGLFSDDD